MVVYLYIVARFDREEYREYRGADGRAKWESEKGKGKKGREKWEEGKMEGLIMAKIKNRE